MRTDTEAGVIAASCWRPVSHGLPLGVPSSVKAWILLDSSMTRMLQKTFGREVNINVLCDSSGPLLKDEAPLLNTQDPVGHVREVSLKCGERSRVAARTVYVASRLRAHHDLASLGQRPLGELLFAKGSPAWLLRECVLLDEWMPLFRLVRHAAGDTVGSCWARRTVFLFEGERLLVTEVFLPAMFAQP